MKRLFGSLFWLFFLSLPLVGQTQSETSMDIEIHLLFGSYVNDHYKKEFHAKERKWNLDNKQFNYTIDAHGKTYGDTLLLDDEEIKQLTDLIHRVNLQTVAINEKVDFAKKLGCSYIIKGKIRYDHQEYQIDIRTNSFSLIDKTEEAQKIKQIEDLFYQFIENHRN